jgi:hypothetical protein
MMKKILISSLVIISALLAQELATEQVTLLDPIAKALPDAATPVLEVNRLEVPPEDIISTKVVIRDGQKFTIQKIEPQEITPLPIPPPPQPLTPEQESARAAHRASMRKFRTLMVSCTVHDGSKTLLRWSSQDKDPVEHFAAWSNVNFHHLTSLTRFKKKDTTYNVMFGIGEVNTAQMTLLHARRNKTYTPPTIPELPADSKTSPSYRVTEGTPTDEDLAPIDGLHEIFHEHHTDLIAEHLRIKAENAQRAAELAANPPDPTPDLIIRYWTPEKTLAEKQQEQNQEGEAK